MSRFHTYRVVLAEHDMDHKEGPEQSIMVENMIIHPKWNKNCVSCGYVQKKKHKTLDLIKNGTINISSSDSESFYVITAV